VTSGTLSMQSRWFITALRLPYLPSGQYDLELNRIEGKDGVGIVLPLARQHQVTLVLGGYPELGGLDGLNYVDGKNLAENGTGKSSCLENAHKPVYAFFPFQISNTASEKICSINNHLSITPCA